MTRLALISEIHGDVAVLDELARQSSNGIVCLGDIAAAGPRPGETIARLRELGCPVVRGNAEG